MSVSNNTQLDANYVRALFAFTITVDVEDEAGAGEQRMSLVTNLQIPGPLESVVGQKFLKKFKYEKTSTARPDKNRPAVLSLGHPKHGNPFVERFRVVDDPRMDIQLSRDALLRVTALWSPESWISVPQCMLKGMTTSSNTLFMLMYIRNNHLRQSDGVPICCSDCSIVASARSWLPD